MDRTTTTNACRRFGKCISFLTSLYIQNINQSSFVQADDSATSEDGSSLSIVSEQDIAASTKEPSSKDSKDETADYDEPSQSPEEGKKVAKSVDPLRWFGILVPPALRSTQSSFIAAIEGPIPQLANISRELRSQEIEIGRVRKQIKKL
jgi:hypothetical protein